MAGHRLECGSVFWGFTFAAFVVVAIWFAHAFEGLLDTGPGVQRDPCGGLSELSEVMTPAFTPLWAEDPRPAVG
jgi:hypothetical protein